MQYGLTVAALVALLAGPATGAAPARPDDRDSFGAVSAVPGVDPGPLAPALEAIAELDVHRLATDRGYAEEFLPFLDGLAPSFEPLGDLEGEFPAAFTSLHALRAVTLVTLERGEAAAEAIDLVLASGIEDPNAYLLAMAAAFGLRDQERTIGAIEAAARLPQVHWPFIRAALHREWVFNYYHGLNQQELDQPRDRLVEALSLLGWPGDHDPDTRDGFRLMVVNNRLEAGDREAAARIAAGIEAPESVVSMLIRRKYDDLWPAGFDRLAAVQRALAAHDGATTAAVAAEPGNVPHLINRARFLRSIGRDGDAYSLLEPLTRNVAATFASEEEGMWLINEVANALVALGRTEEAVALMSRLGAQDIEQRTGLIGPLINQGIILWEAGRYEEALAHALHVERDHRQYANDYGVMWNSSGIACAFASLGRTSEAAERIAAMRAGVDDNPAALTRALLCVNDLDAAEALVIRRLEGNEPGGIVRALQDYTIVPTSHDESEMLFRRLQTLRDRPAVRSALERVGRLISLPLARTYWGEF